MSSISFPFRWEYAALSSILISQCKQSPILEIWPLLSAEAYPYNFYILPLPDESIGKKFYGHVATFDFLMNHNFDFNKLFYEGLYFVNKEDQKSIERTLQTKRIKDQFRTQALQTDKEYLAFKSRYYESVCEEIDRFIEDSQSDSKDLEITLFIKFIKVRVYKYFESVIQDKYPELTFEF